MTTQQSSPALPDSGLNLSDIFKSIPSLKDVEALISTKFSTEAPRLAEISEYLFKLGGKRIRPALTILIAQTFGIANPSQVQHLIDVAAGIELIHMATLLHDDIIDTSPIRRHHPSPYSKFGTNDTLLAGDFLLTRAFSLCARLDRFIIDATEDACIHLTEGEIMETPLYLHTHTLATSRIIAEKKTAALFKLGAVSAGFIAGLRDEALDALGSFGNHLGVSFQMLDDLLDVISPEERLGKRPGTDIKERKPSLINILWLETNSPLSKQLLTEPSNSLGEESFIAEALNEIKNSNVINRARTAARNEALTARESLSKAINLAKNSTIKIDESTLSALDLIVNFTLERME